MGTRTKASLLKFLQSGKHVHPLVIMIIDCTIVILSFLIAYGILSNLPTKHPPILGFSLLDAFLSLLALPVFYFWRLHRGLLRFSSSLALFHVYGAVFSLSVLLVFISFLRQDISGILPKASPLPFLIVLFFISTSLMIVFRLLANSIYTLIKNSAPRKRLRLLICGVDHPAFLLKKALENDHDIDYVIVGFIDTNDKLVNSYLGQTKVYSLNNLPKLKETNAFDFVLLMNEKLNSRMNRTVIERCMHAGIQILTVPAAQKWLLGKLDGKQIQGLDIEDLVHASTMDFSAEKIRNEVYGERILVTGAAGVIGSEIVRQLLKHAPELLILCDQAESPLHEIQLEAQDAYPTARIETILVDICNLERLTTVFETHRPTRVYHAAAYKHIHMVENNPCEAVAVNIEGTKNLADLSLAFQVAKFVMVSTQYAQNPLNIMGASKRLAEIYLQSLHPKKPFNTRFTSVRIGNVMNATGAVIPRFRNQLTKGGPLTLTHLEMRCTFISLSHAGQLVLQAGAMGKGGEIFTNTKGKSVRILEVAKIMIQLAGLTLGKDIHISLIGLRPGEFIEENHFAGKENSISTDHQELRLLLEESQSYPILQKDINELIELNKLNDKEDLLLKFKEILPHFKTYSCSFEPQNAQSISA